MSKDILKDSRFSKLLSDPKYREIPKTERKVKIDKRFQSMFNDGLFKIKYTVDKRGRPVNQSSTENLQRFYDLSSEESSEDSEDDDDEKDRQSEIAKFDNVHLSHHVESLQTKENNKKVNENNVTQKGKVEIHPSNDKLQKGDLSDVAKKRLKNLDIDYARGEGILFTDSSSDEDSNDEEKETKTEVAHDWGELDADAETTEESTNRLAACNMDWDNMKAVDIMVLFNSFLPSGGIIRRVSVYPSEYGIRRMKEEEQHGPIELTQATNEEMPDDEDDDNEEGSQFHMEKLRKYQLNRLKYYYAVIECDSVSTADKLYSECDGLEYESSATKLDLRFIGDDVTFDQEPREICTELPDLSKYRPRLFTTTALQQAKVELTWDTTNPDRIDTIRNALEGNMDEANLKEYLASSSSDSESADEENNELVTGEVSIEKYRSLLQDIKSKEEEKNNKEVEMEITWGMGVKEKTEEILKKKMLNDTNMTPFQKFVEKRKEKRKQNRIDKKNKTDKDNESSSDDVPSDIDLNDPYFAEELENPQFKAKKKTMRKGNKYSDDDETKRKTAELELLLDDDDGKAHFSLRKIQEAEINTKSKKKRQMKASKKQHKSDKDLPDFEVNPNDARFSAIYSSHHYNIDPTDPNFKKTKGMETLIKEKLKRRPKEMPVEEIDSSKKPKSDAAMNVLIKSIKRKTQNILNNGR